MHKQRCWRLQRASKWPPGITLRTRFRYEFFHLGCLDHRYFEGVDACFNFRKAPLTRDLKEVFKQGIERLVPFARVASKGTLNGLLYLDLNDLSHGVHHSIQLRQNHTT